jgi:hypothetical protein
MARLFNAGIVYVGEVFAGEGFEFAADDVGGKTGAEQAAVEGSQFAVVDFTAEGTQLALDALSDDGGLVGVLGGFFEGGFDVAVGNATGAEVACHTKLALFSSLGALPGELLGVACVIDVAVLLETGDDFLDEVFVGGATDEGFFHFGDGMRAAHKDFDGSVVQSGFGVKLAGLGEHVGSIEEKRPSGQWRVARKR